MTKILTGMQLKIKRIEKKIRAQDIAKGMGVTSAYISMLESEKQEVPRHIYTKWINLLDLENAPVK